MASGAGTPSRVAGSVPFRTARLLLAALLLVLAGCGGTEINPPQAPEDSTDARAAGAATALKRLAAGLADRDRSAVTALAAPDQESRAALTALYANAGALRLRDLGFRYVDDEAGGVDERAARRYGDRAWAAAVTGTWRVDGFDSGRTQLPTRFTFAQTGKGVRIVSAGGGGDRGALWLDGPVKVARGGDSLVVTAGADPARFARLAAQAVTDVRKVLRSWQGSLVVEVPSSEAQLERVLGADKGEYSAIAAVTTTVDGSLAAGTPVHVFVNPMVFDGLGARGSQVVLSHEATHVATDASFATMPTWLLEGFADFVALDHAHIPLRTAAGQILRQVRDKGAPAGLPTAQDLDPSAQALGATYEEAWTACRYLGQRYGEATMVAFYRAVDGGLSTRAAFQRVVGTTQQAFVHDWSRDLVRLAGGQGGA